MNPAFPIGDVNITVAVSVLFPQPGPPPTLLQTGTLTVSVTAAYTWAVTQFGPCAAGCGPGLAYRDVSCTDAETGGAGCSILLYCALWTIRV